MGAKKKKKELTFVEKMLLLKKAGIKDSKPINIEAVENTDKTLSLEDRIQKVLGIFNNYKKKKNHMLYFIMYDIENDKVRTRIAKYLEKKGCTRVQKSIFFAESKRDRYNELHKTLKEVQELYDNNDSLFFVPVSTDEIRAMKILGKNVNFDLIMDNKNTLFF